MIQKTFTDDRAVSPVVGVALLIAIAVILAAVIGAVVLGIGTGGAETPQAQLNADFKDKTGDGDIDNVTVRHQGGEPLDDNEIVFVDSAGTEIEPTFADGELTAGESHEESWTDDELVVVWADPDSDTETVIEEFEA